LYWLEPFYGDYGTAAASFSSSLGLRSLQKLLPADALIDVDRKRLEVSRRLCGEPASCFVVRNAPPLAFARRRIPNNHTNVIKLVYAGSITGLGTEGIEHMVRAVAISEERFTLTILPAEGSMAAESLAEMIRELAAAARVILKDQVERNRLPDTLTQFDIGVVLYPVRPGQNNNSLMAAPNKLYEYLASGLSIIASNNETMQFVSREGLGWNLAGESPEETAEFLYRLHKAEVEACCQRAESAFRERYNYESQAEPVLQWFVRRLGDYN
jgi:glycosyltransferase involved in cell wall biosynthesis